MKTLFHPELIDREFGSQLLHVPALLDWARSRQLHMQTVPPIDGFEFVQAEALLCAIERAPHNLTFEQARDVVARDPALKNDRAAEIAPDWLLSAEAHLKWRKVLTEAMQAGELTLLDFASKLPVNGLTQPAITPAPVNRAEIREQRQDQRLARLRALGGDRVYKNNEWKTTGNGAFTRLVAALKTANESSCDEKSVRADLTAAAGREREAKRNGAFSGLGSR